MQSLQFSVEESNPEMSRYLLNAIRLRLQTQDSTNKPVYLNFAPFLSLVSSTFISLHNSYKAVSWNKRNLWVKLCWHVWGCINILWNHKKHLLSSVQPIWDVMFNFKGCFHSQKLKQSLFHIQALKLGSRYPWWWLIVAGATVRSRTASKAIQGSFKELNVLSLWL